MSSKSKKGTPVVKVDWFRLNCIIIGLVIGSIVAYLLIKVLSS